MPRITIAIDGHSSTGKSTVAKQLAEYIGYVYVDSGAMYRAVTLFALQNKLSNEELLERLQEINIALRPEKGGTVVLLNGTDVSKDIRTMEVSNRVSEIAALPEVRAKLVEQQRLMRQDNGVVMDGRDIGTVVFPDAELKLFMTASAAVRAQRRYQELLERGDKVTYQEVLKNVTERDHIDSTREVSPLKAAPDAITIDNSEMNLEDQFHVVLQLAKDRIAGRV